MNAHLLCLLAVSLPAAETAQNDSVYTPRSEFAMAIRGQSPFYEGGPGMQPSPGVTLGEGYNNPTFTSPGTTPGYVPNQQFTPVAPGVVGSPGIVGGPSYDPFMNGLPPGAVNTIPGYGSPYGQFASPLNGPQPFRFGWTTRWDFTYIFEGDATADGGTDIGNIDVFELDLEWEYVTQGPRGWIWTWTPSFGYRHFDGPQPGVLPNGPAPNINSSFFSFGLPVKINSPSNGPWSWEGGFSPSINSDLDQSWNSDAWNFDAHMVTYFRANPEWMWAIGAAYWQRAEDIVIPYGGLIWTPNQNWEWRFIFPKPRVDVFLGNWASGPTWLYVGAEYQVESYQAGITGSPTRSTDQLQIEDWRAFLGLRGDNGHLAHYIEVGAVFDRQYSFKDDTVGFEADDALMLRFGFRY